MTRPNIWMTMTNHLESDNLKCLQTYMRIAETIVAPLLMSEILPGSARANNQNMIALLMQYKAASPTMCRTSGLEDCNATVRWTSLRERVLEVLVRSERSGESLRD